MPIIGFNFKKISVERKEKVTGKINIGNNVAITNAVQQDLSLGASKQKGIRFAFDFSVKYEPKMADIMMTGDIVYIGDEKKISEVMGEWKKNKKIPPDVSAEILNAALTRCNIQALILSREMGLPAPIPLPRISPEGIKEEKK
ncbi:hypothetical protein KY317_03720 [Candidatus Woesearchaeota archaeon]|nr:hypothetical protein [Candidatus Woesearchaeota archaeon]